MCIRDRSNINEELEGTNIERINFEYCKMHATNFHNSNMHCCGYFHCDVSQANFKDTKNTASGFYFCNMFNAKVTNMELTGGVIKCCEISMLVNFDTVSMSGLRLEDNNISDELMGLFYDNAY